jgi:hypothetical protein
MNPEIYPDYTRNILEVILHFQQPIYNEIFAKRDG